MWDMLVGITTGTTWRWWLGDRTCRQSRRLFLRDARSSQVAWRRWYWISACPSLRLVEWENGAGWSWEWSHGFYGRRKTQNSPRPVLPGSCRSHRTNTTWPHFTLTLRQTSLITRLQQSHPIIFSNVANREVIHFCGGCASKKPSHSQPFLSLSPVSLSVHDCVIPFTTTSESDNRCLLKNVGPTNQCLKVTIEFQLFHLPNVDITGSRCVSLVVSRYYYDVSPITITVSRHRFVSAKFVC